jgi:hypothetical protein
MSGVVISSVMVAFNLNLSPLFDAIAQVESGNGRYGKNVYQLQDIYIDDVNRILGRKEFKYEDKFDVGKSREMMVIYWGRYGSIYESKTGNAVSYSVLARIHYGGPDGWKKYATKRYAKKVMSLIEEKK